jgi:uncharacterized integral membrane protein
LLKKPLHVFVDRIRGLSLDLCVGAFLSAEMARKVTSSDQSMLVSVLVICAVYVIYVVDHLYDYQKSLRSAYSHNFSLMHTSQHFNWLVGVILFVMTGYLLGVFIGRQKLLQHRNYGLITDAVLIFPAVYFIVMF